jgi:hypothetical protein
MAVLVCPTVLVDDALDETPIPVEVLPMPALPLIPPVPAPAAPPPRGDTGPGALSRASDRRARRPCPGASVVPTARGAHHVRPDTLPTNRIDPEPGALSSAKRLPLGSYRGIPMDSPPAHSEPGLFRLISAGLRPRVPRCSASARRQLDGGGPLMVRGSCGRCAGRLCRATSVGQAASGFGATSMVDDGSNGYCSSTM